MSEETTIDRAADLAAIRARWADGDLMHLEMAILAPADIRALLARLDSAHALLADMRAWLELRAAQTALTPVMDRLLTAICRELEG